MKYSHIVIKDGVWYPAGADVPVENTVKVEMTDNVPEGDLDTNADGSVNAYDADGNVVETVSSEAVEKLQEQAGETFEEPEKPKRSRKSKEE